MKSTNNHYRAQIGTARERNKVLVSAALLGALMLASASVAMAQVYGVAQRTTVVHGPNVTVAKRTTVVAGGGGLPHGYVAVLPGGYRAVHVSGVCRGTLTSRNSVQI
jgi:hypothetical protein